MTPRRQLLTRADRVASILRAAAHAFAAAGYAGTSMEDIAAAAGVTKLIIYRHFDSKQQLYEAVLDGTRTRLADVLRAGRGPDADMIRPLLVAARAEPDAFTLLFRHASREPRFARYARDFTDRAVDFAQRAVAPTVTDATLRRWLARLVFTLTIEGVLGWLETGDPADDDLLAERLLRASAAVLATFGEDGTDAGAAQHHFDPDRGVV